MAAEETTNQGNITNEYNLARTGLNLDSSVAQINKGSLTYALNANVENFDANSVNYQNEAGNELCVQFPDNFILIGKHFIPEQSKHVFFLMKPSTINPEYQIGYMVNNDCVYHTYVKGLCLNFDVNFPIHKVVHKIANCVVSDVPSIEIYWTDGLNPRRYLDLSDFTDDHELTDCNVLNIQPNFDIPQLTVTDVVNGGELLAGTYQFAIQYCSSTGVGYTSYYSITNPLPIANTTIETLDFNYQVNKSIQLSITNIDINDYFDYYNIAVIKTINNATSAELLGTYLIDKNSATPGTTTVTYSGQNKTPIAVAIEEIFEKYPYYDVAEDVTSVQDVLIWDGLKSNSRVNYQKIAAQITLNWQSYKMAAGQNYADELNATELRGYLRDEIYAFEIVFLLKNGKQTDGFHIPGRLIEPADEVDVPISNPDYINPIPDSVAPVKYWTVYNTAAEIGDGVGEPINGATPHKYGKFAYWESKDEKYPNKPEIWGDPTTTSWGLAGKPIRHHKFPDILVSPAFESATPIEVAGKYQVEMKNASALYPLGVRVSTSQIEDLIFNSTLSQQEKADITGYKIVRGNRNTNKSIVAKGILRNVGKYTRDETTATNPTYYYYPNYPYNDLNTDPFLLAQNNAYSAQSAVYKITNVTAIGAVTYTDIFTNEVKTQLISGPEYIRSTTVPQKNGNLVCTIENDGQLSRYTSTVIITVESDGTSDYTRFKYTPPYQNEIGIKVGVTAASDIFASPKAVVVRFTEIPGTVLGGIQYVSGSKKYTLTASDSFNPDCYPDPFNGFTKNDATAKESKYRQVFNSPETSFGQPTLGDVLKLENVMYGAGQAHFVPVKNNASYRLITIAAQQSALISSYDVANGDVNAAFAAYQAYLQIYISAITRKNFAYSFNSIASYDYFGNIQNGDGVKQRQLARYQYAYPGVQSVGDTWDLNNFQRESSVYLKTIDKRGDGTTTVLPLGFPNEVDSIAGKISDQSRFTLSQTGKCAVPGEVQPIKVVSYYGSIKNIIPNQWGQLYSYETIDTGFQIDRDILPSSGIATVFGGDTFIGKFAFKTKLPFFIDNRVGAPDDSDIAFDQLGNIAYPQYWHSSRSILRDVNVAGDTLNNFISRKAHYFDCPNDPIYTIANQSRQIIPSDPPDQTESSTVTSFYDGKMYLFAYGIPYFYCESSINLDLRQAYNGNDGNFYPRVSSGIPDDWLQQVRVPIAQDNTYYYNLSYSKQNLENYFSHLPNDWTNSVCEKEFPFRAIYSDQQSSSTTSKVNNWLLYRPISFFDFPQTYGKLTSLDSIQNKGILARFENKSLLYNTMLTIDTSNPQAAYVGNPTLFKSAPPIDFAETDLGYVGSQHKMLLKIPNGQITVDAKRGQIFLIQGNQVVDLTAFGSGVNRFMTDHLAFEILRYFPQADVDNNFTKVGLTGVYDSKFDRIIISKLDYIPQPAWVGKIFYGVDPADTGYYKEYYFYPIAGDLTTREIIQLTDITYFCNKSWTLSYNMNTKSWVSFHSYIPSYYIAENNFFYSGNNQGCGLTAIAAGPSTTTSTTTYHGPPTTSTTSSTTTYHGPPTTTSTTTTSYVPLDVVCGIAGNAVYIEPCTFIGNAVKDSCLFTIGAVGYTPTTTTTTSTSTSSTTSTTSTSSTSSTSTSTSTTSTSTTQTPTSTTTSTSTTVFVPTTTTSTTTADPSLTTTTTTTIFVPTTTTTTTTGIPTTTTTTTTDPSITTTTTTSTSSTTSTTSTTTTIACTPIVNGDWTFTGPTAVLPFQQAIYTVTMSAPSSSSYPITVGSAVAGAIARTPATLVFTSAGSQTITVDWDGTPTGNYIQAFISGSACTDLSDPIRLNMTPGTTTTTTSTSTTAAPPGTVSITPLNSLSGTSYTPYINGTSDGSWDSGSRSYAVGTTIYINYASPACNVTLNGSVYTSGSPITIASGATYAFQLKNYDNWVNNGAVGCYGSNAWKQPIINDCGNTDFIIIDPCSCNCNQACDGTYWDADWSCVSGQSVKYERYSCNGVVTGNVDTNPNCAVACTGTYWAETCSGTTLTRTQKYSCNNANTGAVETIPCSVSGCGASTSQIASVDPIGTRYTCSLGTVIETPVYVNTNTCYTGTAIYLAGGTWTVTNPSGSYPSTAATWADTGTIRCISGSCYQEKEQRNTNQCSPTYNATQYVPTGSTSSSCGLDYWEEYCVNYGVAPYERRKRLVNTCTGPTGADVLVGYDSVDCGYYTPLPSFSISTVVGDPGFACTRTIGGIAYCEGGYPSVGTTVHTTSNPSSTVFSAGFYHINVAGDEYIEINGSGVVVGNGAC